MFVWAGKPVKNGSGLNLFKDGKARDERNIHNMIRLRADDSGPYRTKCSRREMRKKLIDEGFVFFKTQPKHRYVNLVGDRETVRKLRAALKWNGYQYPKRQADA